MPAKIKCTDEQLINAVKNNNTWIDIRNALGLNKNSSNEHLKKRCIKLNISFSHVQRKNKHSDETRKLMSENKKKWCKENKNKHTWSVYTDRKKRKWSGKTF